jgi:excisionase family DNA binding protein
LLREQVSNLAREGGAVTTVKAAEWISPEQLAAELGIPIKTVYQWRYLRTGPRGHRIGRHVRYRRRDIEAWLATQADADRGDAA